MNLNIYDLTFKKLGDLVNEQGHSAKGITVNEKMNEIWGLSFSLRDDNPYFTYVINGNLVQFDNQLYEITDVSKQNSANDGVVYSVSCKHFAKTLQTKIITEAVLDPVNATDFMDFILNGYGGGELGWGVGTIDSPSNRYRAIEIKEQSVFQTIAEAAERYDCWVQYDAYEQGGAVYLTINMYAKNAHIGSEVPFTFYERKHIKNISVSRNTDEMATRLYAFGGTNPSTGIDVDLFDAIVGGVPYAKTYVEDYSYFLNQGYSQSYINDHPELFRKEATWRDSNYLDANTLYQDALKQLAERAVPKITVNMTNIMKDVRLPRIGEQANVVDTRLNENLTFTIEGRSINYDSPWEVKYQVSNVIGYRNFITDLHKSSIKTRYAVNDDGTVRREAVRDVIQTTELIANMIKTGDLTVGGSGHVGSIVVLNDLGNVRATINTSGIQVVGTIGATGFTGLYDYYGVSSKFTLVDGTHPGFQIDLEGIYTDGYEPILFSTKHIRASYSNNGTTHWNTNASFLYIFGTAIQIGSTRIDFGVPAYTSGGALVTSGLRYKENVLPVKSQKTEVVKTLNSEHKEEISYKEDFIDLLNTIADKECVFNYKQNKNKEIQPELVQLGVIADEISGHKAYKYIGVKNLEEDGSYEHALKLMPMTMLSIMGYGYLRDKIAMLENELKELKVNKK